jgi:hypothetical protein
MAHRDPAAARSLERSQAHGTQANEFGPVLTALADRLMLSVGYGTRPRAALGKDPLPGPVDRLMELALL